MKPLFTKKNGTSQRVAAIEVKMPASYPSANVTYGSGSVEDALDKLEFVVDTKTATDISIAANAFGDSATDVSKSGYTPLAIVGFNGSNSYANPVRWYLSGNTANVKFYNAASSSLSTVSPTLYILYKKS